MSLGIFFFKLLVFRKYSTYKLFELDWILIFRLRSHLASLLLTSIWVKFYWNRCLSALGYLTNFLCMPNNQLEEFLVLFQKLTRRWCISTSILRTFPSSRGPFRCLISGTRLYEKVSLRIRVNKKKSVMSNHLSPSFNSNEVSGLLTICFERASIDQRWT